MSYQVNQNGITSRRSFLYLAGGSLAAKATLRGSVLLAAQEGGTSSAQHLNEQGMPPFTEHRVPRDGHFLYAQEFAGVGPTLILLHGFPDNLHIYDRLIPLLASAGRHIVAFDFLGFGASDKPAGYTYSFDQQRGDIEAVVAFLKLDKVIPVAHDAGAVAAFEYVFANSPRVKSLCLLNSFFGSTPTLRFPELIALFADPDLKALAHAIIADPKQVAFILNFQNHQFQASASQAFKDIADNVLQPIINKNFAQHPSAGSAFAQMTGSLNPQMKLNDRQLPQLAALRVPVSIIWGKEDQYLNQGVAEDFHNRLKNSSLQFIDA